MNYDKHNVRWAVSWVCLVAAFGLHVADEALTGFLPFYNSIIASLRETYGWVPLPTFAFSVWLAGLIGIVVVLFALTPLVLPSMGVFAPGVYSSPILLAASIALVVMTSRAKRHAASSKVH